MALGIFVDYPYGTGLTSRHVRQLAILLHPVQSTEIKKFFAFAYLGANESAIRHVWSAVA